MNMNDLRIVLHKSFKQLKDMIKKKDCPKWIGIFVIALFWIGLLSFRSNHGNSYSKKIVSSKAVKIDRGSTCWVMAFSDGTSIDVDFGAYTKYNIGDTVCIQRNAPHRSFSGPTSFWIFVPCRNDAR